MSKLISNIQNYPLSEGSVALSNKMLLDDTFALQENELKDYFKQQLEFSKDIYFYNNLGTNTNRWYDLLSKSNLFQFSKFLSTTSEELHHFFINLPQSNHFNSDVELSQAEYEILGYQKLQILQYLFWFYKIISESVQDENQDQVQSILKSDPISKLFIQFGALTNECLFDGTVLIKVANRKSAENLNEIKFPEIESAFVADLNNYYNPSLIAGNQVLNIYANKFDKIKAANEYAYSIFKNLLQIHQTFSYWAKSKLTEFTDKTDTNQPHIALLVAFCKLKMLYDARYNQLIHSHTSFIYSEILQLKKQVVLPDTAFVNIELAKNINSFLIEKNSLFKAGKNADNQPVYYQSSQQLVLNAGKIAQLKSTVRLQKNGELMAITATDEASSTEWQVNDAWLPFNDISQSHTGIAIESKLLLGVEKKGTLIDFEFTFDHNVPEADDLTDKFSISLLLKDETEEILTITNVVVDDYILKISAKLEKDLKNLKEGINARLKLVSPSKNEQEDEVFEILYKYLLSEQVGKIKVKMNQKGFAPIKIETTAGTIDGQTSFAAFGSQSLAGSSFRIHHPFIRFAEDIDIQINWAEKLKEKSIGASVNSKVVIIPGDTDQSLLNDINVNQPVGLRIKIASDLTYKVTSTKKSNNRTSTIESTLPRVLTIKNIELSADLEELVYEKENTKTILFKEIYYNSFQFIRSLRIPFTNKNKQKIRLHERHKNLRMRFLRLHYNNQTAHLYPFGELKVHKNSGLTFLPDYSILGFNDFDADLCIGLTNIIPGQSISLLFEIANETAEQSEREAKISWFFVSENNFLAIENSKIFDSTHNFLQTGIVQLSLPDIATVNDSIFYGKDTYWLIARCNTNYDVVANIISVKNNGLAISRLFNDQNQEAKKSVAPATIENIYPKTANIKAVTQNTPSQNGREIEPDKHYFWRVSQRLRHKSRAINQWDYENLVLEKFSNIYKVKALNHAYFDSVENHILAKPTHCIVLLIPHFVVNNQTANFQPAIPLSKLLEVKEYLLSKTSAFNQLQVVNSQWDEIKIEVEVMLNKDILDLPFYREKLNEDLKKFFSPWAFEGSQTGNLANKMYAATLVDFIDELAYVHHVKSLKILKNEVEVFDEMVASSEIHFLTSAIEHTVTVCEYDS
ncbi:MAG: hypothetical protein V4683_12165 [Bacteroidota bacterium]